MTPRLKLNWYPAQVPSSPLIVDAALHAERDDYRGDSSVRQYSYNGQWLVTNIAAEIDETRFGEYKIDCEELPQLTSTLIFTAFLSSFRSNGFIVDSGLGESFVFRQSNVPALPATIHFFEGMRVKPFSTRINRSMAFGLVLDYATHQEFAQTLALDVTQLGLAKNGHPVKVVNRLDTHFSGIISDISGNKVTVMNRSRKMDFTLDELKLVPSYQVIREYVDIAKLPGARTVIRTLQVESFSLTHSGSRNLYRLANRYNKVSELLDRDKRANISLRLATLCQSVVSLATECTDIEMRFQ